ncbi:TorE protein [Ignatzschineria rhizosphaerae]|uniref:TorE protein n=1 Tax=Ignatzschineria rhizosphaerae TaxID=2923279 RepID=A0ABY3X2J5_9GAMM|nr:TorE protein [Ignatzschineria rhizosphaerae]UNM97064.1 TorE protein [Ignatzschineria rhizosphaerae]
MKKHHLASRHNQGDSVTKGGDWGRFILLMVIVLPILAFCVIGAYGLGTWIMQILFWGPPS